MKNNVHFFNKLTLSTAEVLLCHLVLPVLRHGTHLNMSVIEVQRG